MTERNRGNFFAIDKAQWSGVCELGMNPALLYLFLARGSDKLNTMTSWSANALEKYTAVSRTRAKSARMTLLNSGFVNVLKGGRHPKYELLRSTGFQTKRDEIWLPNELVTGAAGEVTAIERVRQTADVMRLKLLVDLYYQQNLVDDCGIARACVYKSYDRKRIAESGVFTIWGFSCTATYYCYRNNEAVSPHYCRDNELFFDRFGTLCDLGLIVVTPYLCESDAPDAEIIHPLGNVFDCEDLSLVVEEAVMRMLPEQYEHETDFHEFLVPVPRHVGNVAVVGIAQTLFRPRTSLTAAGKAHHVDRISAYREAYENMALEDDMQYQGYIKVGSRSLQRT